jgi:hypothetical protein
VIGPDGKPLDRHFTVIFEYHLRGKKLDKKELAKLVKASFDPFEKEE